MTLLEAIENKRDGKKLTSAQIQLFVDGASGSAPDYQLAAMLMAIYLKGMDAEEVAHLTKAMRDSGEVLKFNDPFVVDKHSTGGIGDKISLPLAPLLACLGLKVPMISGRGLGITGGTLDKLDSIPGFQTKLTADQIYQQIATVGCVICGQTSTMVPADRKLYALRDVTGTVPSLPLITGSILSKKLAEGIKALVLDVKFGKGAFMQTAEEAKALALAMKELGEACGVKTTAILSDMNEPIGQAAGNWVEVVETEAYLKNPQAFPDLHELVLISAACLLLSTGKSQSLEEGKEQAAQMLASPAPLAKWHAMLKAQGTDMVAYEAKLRNPSDYIAVPIKTSRSGYLKSVNARLLGEVIRDIGGGRVTATDTLNYEVGICSLQKVGTVIVENSVLAEIRFPSSYTQEQMQPFLAKALVAFEVTQSSSPTNPRITAII